MKKTVLVCAAVAALASATAFAQGAAKPQYVGAGKCKMCHNTAKQGKIYDVWMATKHAQAFTVLASEEAKKIGTAKGIADPQKADACLKCHVTGHTAPAAERGEKWAATEGVTCESCHGAGSLYWKNDVMKAIAADSTKAAAVGLLHPSEKTCVGCHNAESPTFKEFNFKAMWAKIEHKIPAEAAPATK